MPVELKDLRLKLRRRIELDLGEEAALTVWWSPDKYDDAFLLGASERAAAEQAAEDGDEVAQQRYCHDLAEGMLVPLLAAWDLEDGGKPWPITADNVASLGIFVVAKLSGAINADATDYRAVKKPSGGG